MRKFIVSDLQGCGEVYDSIMGYLENIALVDDVELYINGDLIDRGLDGYRMLEDVIQRIHGKGDIQVHYLAGNHELMMYQALMERKPGKAFNPWSNWMCNGGWVIEGELDAMDEGEEKCEEFKHFLGGLDVYHKFPEYVDGNQLLLVHAQAPRKILDQCDMKIADDDKKVEDAVWTRAERRNSFLWFVGEIIGYNRIGKYGYLTIIGHTPVHNSNGFYYQREGNYLNIDGGCAPYAVGRFEYDHVPMVEVKNNQLDILIFNHNNEIMNGYVFNGEMFVMGAKELEQARTFINHDYDNCGEVSKKLIKEVFDQ